jgi:hypothetical protein
VNRALKAGTVAIGVVGLLVLVALASRGGHPSSDGRVAPRPVPVSLQDNLLTLLAVAYVFTIIVVVVFMFSRRPWHAPDESRWLRSVVSAGVALLILTGIGYWALHHRAPLGSGTRQNVPVFQAGGSRAEPGPSSAEPVRHAKFQWPLALAFGGLIALGALALLVRDRMGDAGPAEAKTVADELAEVVETTMADLRSERDPRRAVIAAYAKMEHVLASNGLARKRAETQLEYLERILTELEVAETAVRKLTQLFAYAKFSPHAIDESMRDEAIEALTAVRRDLRAEVWAAA